MQICNISDEEKPECENDIRKFQCGNEKCINSSKICDYTEDCPNGEDEKQDCGE